jgi:hypothetical protein
LSIPLASIFFYDTLICLLLEEEGLLEARVVVQLTARLMAINARVVSERNLKIVVHALNQDTWLKKRQVVSTNFGQSDPSDFPASLEQQLLRLQDMF